MLTCYPHQTRIALVDLSADISGSFQENRGVHFFILCNLTKNAPTCNGFHQPSNATLAEAQYVLNYVDMLPV